MRRACQVMMMLTLIAVIAAPLAAQEKKKGKKRQKQRQPMAQLLAQVKKAEPTEEQTKQIREILAKVKKELVELQGAVKLTPEQMKAQREARTKAQADGKKGKEMRDAIDAAMKLTDDQKKARAKLQKLQGDVRKKVMALLSAEQIEKAGLKAGRQRGGKKRKKGDG